MACVGRVARSEEERKYEHCEAERDRDRTVTQDKQQRESEIKERNEEGVRRRGYIPPASRERDIGAFTLLR
jgi:uncharacterized protein YdaT